MRKFMVVLACVIAPFIFSSCEELEGLVGSMTLTIGDETYNIPDALFYEKDGVTYLAGSNIQETVAIEFTGDSVGTYTLGLGENLLSAAGNISQITNMDNTLIYIPASGLEEDGSTAICGTLKITKYTSTAMEGEFSGYILKSALITGGDIDWTDLESNLQQFSGSFEAVSQPLPEVEL